MGCYFYFARNEYVLGGCRTKNQDAAAARRARLERFEVTANNCIDANNDNSY